MAALLGAVVVVLLTLTQAPGAWGYFSTIAGALLLCFLVAFFARHPVTAKRRLESYVVALALAALVGIAGAVTVAWPVQDNYFSDSPYCRAVGVNAAVNAVQNLSETGGPDAGTLGATRSELQRLAQQQFDSPTPVDDHETAMSAAFNLAYVNASGDCLAGDTSDHLWLVALPLSGVTLIWWFSVHFVIWKRRESTSSEATANSMRDSYPAPTG